MVRPTCRWAMTNGAGMISKPNTRSVAARLTLAPGEGAQALAPQVFGDPAEHLGKVGAGAAAGVEDVDVVGGESVGDAEIVLEGAVDAGDHVAYDLVGRVPDAELLAEPGIECFEKRLVEVGHRLATGSGGGHAGVEAGEECLLVHAVEGGGGPVEDLDEAEGPQPAGVG